MRVAIEQVSSFSPLGLLSVGAERGPVAMSPLLCERPAASLGRQSQLFFCKAAILRAFAFFRLPLCQLFLITKSC